MQTAVALHREGKLDAAEQLYRKYLAAWPHNAHAWPNLGALQRTRGLYQPSIAAHRKALPNLHLGSRLVEGKSYQAY